MNIRFLFFASIREAAKTRELELDIPGGNVNDALSHLETRIPELRRHLDRVQIAVNEEYSDRNRSLREGDTVALIPPVSGGKS